jgi:hypothetical protein
VLRVSALAGLIASFAWAPAATGSGEPVDVSAPGVDIEDVGIATNAAGDGVVAWNQTDRRSGVERLVARFGPGLTGAWAGPQFFARSDVGLLRGPLVALTPDGTSYVLWMRGHRVLVSAAARDGAFSRARVVATGDISLENVAVAASPEGTVMIVWVQTINGRDALRAVTRSSLLGWGAPQLISRSSPQRTLGAPQIVFDGRGKATVVWARSGPPVSAIPAAHTSRLPTKDEIRAAVRRPSGRFGGTQVVSNPRIDADEAAVAINDRGDALIAWVSLTDERRVRFRVGGARRNGSGRFARPTWLSPPKVDASAAGAVIDADGRALVTWRVPSSKYGRDGCNCFQVQGRAQSASGALAAPYNITRPNIDDLSVAGNRVGQAVALWTEPLSRTQPLNYRTVTTTGVLGATRMLSPTFEQGTFDLSATGQGLAAWVVNHRLQAAPFTAG